MDLYKKIIEIINDKERVSVNETVLQHHGQGMTYHEPRTPEIVVFPVTKDEIEAVVMFASKHEVPLVPFGAGSAIEGHMIPTKGGISMDLTLMNSIIEIRPDDFLARVEPGVKLEQLNKALRQYGLFFPVDPGADATLGGMAATNASGTNAVKYGAMRDQVLGLEVVLAAGNTIKTGGKVVKSSAGYGLTGLFVGSEGTLGVISEVTIKLYGIPEVIVAGRATFPTLEEAGRAATSVLKAGISLGKVELVDALTIQAVNAFKKTEYPEVPTLFLEFSGGEEEVKYNVGLTKEVLESEDCLQFKFESDSLKRSLLWEARHHAAFAIAALYPGKKLMSTDVCVPLSMLPDAIARAREIVEEYGIQATIFGHIGDGNYHVVLPVDPADSGSVQRLEEINRKIVIDALEKGGSCTGEHGIGMGKKDYLLMEHGNAVELMKDIKKLFDKKNILNPDKIFDL